MLPNLSLVLLLKFWPKSQWRGAWKEREGLKIHNFVAEELGRGHGINGWQRFASRRVERDCGLGLLILQLMLPSLMMKLLRQCTLPLLDSTFQISWVTHSWWSLQRSVVCLLRNQALIRWKVLWDPKSTTVTNPFEFCAKDTTYYPITEAATPSCLVGIEAMDESTQ